MIDLHTRLRSAIEERLALAQLAERDRASTNRVADRWSTETEELIAAALYGKAGNFAKAPAPTRDGFLAYAQRALTALVDAGVPLGSPECMAAGSPDWVIRACRADLARLEAHRPTTELCNCDEIMCAEHEHTPWLVCPEVRSLAEVWLEESV